jgi:hypothetical protein
MPVIFVQWNNMYMDLLRQQNISGVYSVLSVDCRTVQYFLHGTITYQKKILGQRCKHFQLVGNKKIFLHQETRGTYISIQGLVLPYRFFFCVVP